MRSPQPLASSLVVVMMLLAPLSAHARPERELPGPDASLCKALPVAEIAEQLGAKAGTMAGRDLEDYQSCTAHFGEAVVKIEHHTPGQPGLPADVASGLRGLAATMGSSIEELETHDFGDIGCYRGVLSLGGQRVRTTSCFEPKGYYTMSVATPKAKVPMEELKAILEKTITRSH